MKLFNQSTLCLIYWLHALLSTIPAHSQELPDKKVQQALVFDLSRSVPRIAYNRSPLIFSINTRPPYMGFAFGYAVSVKLNNRIYYRANLSLQTGRDSARVYQGYHFISYETMNRRFDALRLSNHILYGTGKEKSFFLLAGTSNYLDMTRHLEMNYFRFSRLDHSVDFGFAKRIKSEWGYWMPELKMHYGIVNHLKAEERNEEIWGFYRRRIVLSVYFLF